MPEPVDKELYELVKNIVYQQYKKPSAFRSGAVIKEYKKRGGTFRGDKETGDLTRWYKEEWKDIGNKEYPVFRPTKRISKKTPLLVDEIKPSNLKKQIKLKQEIKGMENLPPFEPIEGGRIDLTSFKEGLKKVGRVAKVVAPAVIMPSVGIPIALSQLKKRETGKLPPAVRQFLSDHGNEKITSIEIIRTPVESFLQNILSLVSLGTWKDAVEKAGYDDIFHLALILNGKYMLDKQEVIKIGPPKKTEKTQSLSVPVSKQITFNELLEKTRQKMGDSNFTNYDPKKNNCQDFVLNLLEANEIITNEAREFIKQNAVKIFESTPSFTSKIAKAITDVGAVADRLTEGEGELLKKVQSKEGNGSKPSPHCTKVKIGGKYVMYQNGECYTVMNQTTGRVLAYCTTEEKAKKQIEMLEKMEEQEELEKGFKKDKETIEKLANEAHQKVKEESKKIKRKYISKKQKNKMQSWKQFWAESCKGKKFEKRKAVNDYMREMAKKYKEMKAKAK